MTRGQYLSLFIAFVLVGCMDFGWKSGQFSCDGEGQCPSGFYCDLDQGLCVEGSASDTDTDTDSDSDTDTDTDSDTDTDTDTGECIVAGDCEAPECGSVAGCSAHNECLYSADGGACEYPSGECDVGSCHQESEADSPYCEFVGDWHLCDSGWLCTGETGDYGCVGSGCASGALSTETRLTNNAGESGHMSMVRTDTGFAAVWIDNISSNYGDLYFASFYSSGALNTLNSVATSGDFEFPALAWLGSGDGYALAFQRWTSSQHEVMLVFLDDYGNISGSAVQVSDGSSAHSRYPAIALGDFTGGSRLAVVWMDERNPSSEHDIYCSVYNADTHALVSGNQRLTSDTREEKWPKVVATDTGFVMAVTAYVESGGTVHGEVLTREFSSAGIPQGTAAVAVTPADTALPPADIAWNSTSSQLGLAWRDLRVDDRRRVMFRLLDSTGQHYGDIQGGVVVGPSHDGENSNGLSLVSRTLGTDGFALAWIGHQDDWMGDVSTADVMLSQIRWVGDAADSSAGQVDSAYVICDDPARSAWARLAQLGDVSLVLWQDNREDNTSTDDGEVYGRALDCQ